MLPSEAHSCVFHSADSIFPIRNSFWSFSTATGLSSCTEAQNVCCTFVIKGIAVCSNSRRINSDSQSDPFLPSFLRLLGNQIWPSRQTEAGLALPVTGTSRRDERGPTDTGHVAARVKGLTTRYGHHMAMEPHTELAMLKVKCPFLSR